MTGASVVAIATAPITPARRFETMLDELNVKRVELCKLSGEAVLEVVDLQNLAGPLGQCLDPCDLDKLADILRSLRMAAVCLEARLDEAGEFAPKASE